MKSACAAKKRFGFKSLFEHDDYAVQLSSHDRQFAYPRAIILLTTIKVVVAGENDLSVVWSANRGHPVPQNSTLLLTREEGLVLLNSDGIKIWSTNTSSVAGANISSSGNLILFNNEGIPVWQSFDHPTDTLLVDQKLKEGQRLTASSSPSNWSQGQYYATISSTLGFAAYTEVDQEFSQVGLLVKLGTRAQWNYGEYNVIPSSEGVIVFLKLNNKGRLKIYQHDNDRGLVELLDMVGEDLGECQYPRSCGEYGVCREGQCSCPISLDKDQYFRSVQSQLPSLGCSRITPLSCQQSLNQHQLVEIENVTFFNVIDLGAAFPNIKDIDQCKQACLQNCSCGAAFFSYQNITDDGYCFLPDKILSIRESTFPRTDFAYRTNIKVQIPNGVPELAPLSPPSVKKSNNTATIAGSCTGAFVILCFIVLILSWIRRRNNIDHDEECIGQIPGLPMRFSYEELRLATEEFKEKIGGGGSGTVFKGRLGDGTDIAVKRLDNLSNRTKEFLAEVQSIGSIHHFNLVKLIGFCAEKNCRLLVYEFMKNGSLDNWIFYTGKRSSSHHLNWQTRKEIVLDIVKGLTYLHEECHQKIVHLDIKPHNILLDENFNAKVSDFGLCKFMERDESQIQTTMRGTPGYIAPEWQLLRITIKVDIYSFGIVLLEIVCGRRNFDGTRSESTAHLLKLLQEKAIENKLLELIENYDEEMMMNHKEEVLRMIKIAAWCLQDDHTRRPSMSIILKVLEGVMEVEEENINYYFTHALSHPVLVPPAVVSEPPQASVLSNPR
ncbi:G-type lectin S-receptor-like serine threonine-kinase SD2-5 [Olea europaea subsp. europaea]|uniref:Receptor-like serine/threonine-protein kinase n=1 Tax=Olea europaea subsp. europaea TaxID=158383 RepID=A0A8S0VIG7_OLEEU|nr:G-type lectin S-receptor-like serine threonine-kinase SD2-5 [Olea europaea subsp. europaea]